ncbi:hypothetical protein F5Y10DRAFT_119953 [Nemania abortiva]|nr:hypothetical protein F5Y10DRAFT_119953 [Nemania abortiva]
MPGKKGGGENSKKAAGQARKADAAAAKAAAEDAKKAAAEDQKWEKGAKNNAKKEAEAAKKAEQARKKAENSALLAEDDKNTPGRAVPKKSKTAEKKPSRGLGAALSQLQLEDKQQKPAIGVSGIDGILEAFDVMDPNSIKLDLHPERRVRQAFAAFSERREKEMKDEGLKLNFSQRKQRIREEFEKSPENPLRQAHLTYNATREEREAAVAAEVERKEAYLAKK